MAELEQPGCEQSPSLKQMDPCRFGRRGDDQLGADGEVVHVLRDDGGRPADRGSDVDAGPLRHQQQRVGQHLPARQGPLPF